MEFSIQGKTLSFSDNQIEIAKILKHYHKLASEGREVARVLLIARKFTPIQFVKNGDNFALAIIGSYGEQVIQDFINKGFFSYDESKLKKDFEEEDSFYDDNYCDTWEEAVECKIREILYDFDDVRGLGPEGYEALEKINFDAASYTNLGQERTGIIELYLLAFRLAQEDLKRQESEVQHE